MPDVRVPLPVGDDPPTGRLIYGTDVREGLRLLDDGSVHCVVTSPPYWGLRDYGVAPTRWGDWEGQLGHEDTPALYVEHLVEVFREVRRVLRDDGTLWLNLGDSYAQGRGHGHWTSRKDKGDEHGQRVAGFWAQKGAEDVGLKPKDLVGIPWRVALALQDDGWWLRNDVIWHKANHLPTPVQDRFACSHEHVFLLSKSQHYFFDLDAVRVPHTSGTYDEDGTFTPSQQWHEDGAGSRKMDQTEGRLGSLAGSPRRAGRGLFNPNGKNPGDVWKLPTQPFPGAHFAVWPEVVPERCVKAGTSEYGCCQRCGAPWERDGRLWEPTCPCTRTGLTRPVVLDPFSGSGTTGRVALRLGRDYVGVDLNADYLSMATSRLLGEAVPEKDPPVPEGSVLDVFGVEQP
jgi:site-specific DNA-methyltransferase (cytosine-N4-specific)